MAAVSFSIEASGSRARRAFTLVELLVVIGVIALLVALLIPMVHKAYKNAGRSRMLADLQVISQALEAYKSDQRDYPRAPVGQAPINGAVLLCWALVAPGPAIGPGGGPGGDGVEGPGFRPRGMTSGQVYGPYVTSAQLRTADIVSLSPLTVNPSSSDFSTVFIDRYNNEIYYCPAAPTAFVNLNADNGYVADGGGAVVPMYDHRYFVNNQSIALTASPPAKPFPPSLTSMQLFLNADPSNGRPKGGVASVTQSYLLWGAGMEQNYAPLDNNGQPILRNLVTNFTP